MAEEAFALSPISARAAQPSEADYDAIREAFMETSRGRWFLGEYAKRNRNADTRMVLDAVAKIEEALASQRQPIIEDRTPEVLAAIRKALAEAEQAAAAAVESAAVEPRLDPIQRGVRIIKEISWRWREIGADSRICDLIDSQLTAIEGACEQIATIDPREELEAAFDLIRKEIAQAEVGEAAPTQAATEGAAPVAREPISEAQAATEALAATAEAPSAIVEMPQQAPEPIEVQAGAWSIDSDVIDVAGPETVEVKELPTDAEADAQDEAVLEMVAFEMAAPDPEFDEDIVEPVAVAAEIFRPVATEQIAATEVAEIAPTMESRNPVAARAAPSPAATTAPQPAPEPSLGATILASGILNKPRATANDPLAPIRRMTQAEKIAFFS